MFDYYKNPKIILIHKISWGKVSDVGRVGRISIKSSICEQEVKIERIFNKDDRRLMMNTTTDQKQC
jgi:hypothetical protein